MLLLNMLACRSARTLVQRCTYAVRAFSNVQHGNDIVGIDFGTTNSRLAFMEAEIPTLLETESGQILPSFVAIDSKKKILVGDVAKYHATANPADGLYNLKKLLRMNFFHSEIKKLKTKVPFKIIEGPSGEAWVEVHSEKFSPTIVCAFVMEKMRNLTETYRMRSISKAVIAVPVYFNDDQKKELQFAAKFAGLDVVGIIDEPIAAALSCKSIDNGTLASFSLGGGAFSISILEIFDGVVQVKAKEFDASVGGEDFDIAITEYLVKEIMKVHCVDISVDGIAMMRLKDAAEKAKLELSSYDQARVNLPFLTGSEHGPIHVDITLSRSKFEELTEPLIERIKGMCKRCLEAAHVTEQNIDEVILSGGMSNVQRVQQAIREIFLKSPSMQVNPEEAVAIGALLQCALILEDERKHLPGLIPLCLGIETLEGGFMRVIYRDSEIPCKGICDISTTCDNQDEFSIRVFQGEHLLASKNKLLGQLTLTGMPRAPRGGISIQLEFCADKNGILTVSATIKDIDREWLTRFDYMDQVSEVYIRTVAKKAILCGHRNIKKLSLARLKSMAEFKLHRIEILLKSRRKKMPQIFLADPERMLTDLKSAMDSEEIELLKSMVASASMLEHKLLTEGDPDHYFSLYTT